MTRIRFAFVLVTLFIWVSTAQAQFNDPQLVNYLDTPQDGWTYPYTGLVSFSGWSFHCTFGQQPQVLRVSYRADNGDWIPVTPFYRTGSLFQLLRQYRPDVKVVFSPYCPNVSDYTGFGFQIQEGLPSGIRTIRIEWEDRTGRSTREVTITIQ